MHIALATGCPTIGIFGPTNPEILFPKKSNAYAFQVKNGKWACYTSGTFDVRPNQEYMDTIKAGEVYAKAKELLKKRS